MFDEASVNIWYVKRVESRNPKIPALFGVFDHNGNGDGDVSTTSATNIN